MTIRQIVAAVLSLTAFCAGVPGQRLWEPAAQRYLEQNAALSGEGFQKCGNTIILMYHTFVTEGEPDESQYSLYTTAQKLSDDIDTLRAQGYRSISLWRYRMGLFDPEKKYFILTFDDGYKTNYTVAFPVLKEKGVYADIFANTHTMGAEGHLTWDMCREMEQSGLVHLYSHLDMHTAATELSPEEQPIWLERSNEALSRELGQKQVWGMAYPYGAYDREVFELYRALGAQFQMVQAAQFSHPELLVRINAPYNADMKEIIAKAVHN